MEEFVYEPDSIQIRSYSDMKRIVNWAIQETKEQRAVIADAVVPPRYDLDSLPESYNSIWRKFNALSGADISFDFEGKLMELYWPIFEKGQALEKAGDIDRAMDYYLLVVFNCCPTGTLYYERPAILLERQKRYILALIVCDLGHRAYYMSHGKRIADFPHRRKRLMDKVEKECNPWPKDKYPIYMPPMPEPWIRPLRSVDPDSEIDNLFAGMSLEEVAEYLASDVALIAEERHIDDWASGKTQDAELDEDFRRWQQEKIREMEQQHKSSQNQESSGKNNFTHSRNSKQRGGILGKLFNSHNKKQ